jgi:hypothetical protein
VTQVLTSKTQDPEKEGTAGSGRWENRKAGINIHE